MENMHKANMHKAFQEFLDALSDEQIAEIAIGHKDIWLLEEELPDGDRFAPLSRNYAGDRAMVDCYGRGENLYGAADDCPDFPYPSCGYVLELSREEIKTIAEHERAAICALVGPAQIEDALTIIADRKEAAS